MKALLTSAKGRVSRAVTQKATPQIQRGAGRPVLLEFLKPLLVLALPCVAMAQIAVLQIRILEGDGAVHPPGARLSRPLVVEVTDESGRPVQGAAVSFHLPAEGPGGLFSNGLRTDLAMTDAAGRAAIHGLQLNRTAGRFGIRITAVKEQARAGVVGFQSIAGDHAPAAAIPSPAAPVAATAAKSGEITRTTVKMSSGHRKKWWVIAAVAAGGGAAFLGVSRSSAGKGSTPSSAISIGTPGITVGHP